MKKILTFIGAHVESFIVGAITVIIVLVMVFRKKKSGSNKRKY